MYSYFFSSFLFLFNQDYSTCLRIGTKILLFCNDFMLMYSSIVLHACIYYRYFSSFFFFVCVFSVNSKANYILVIFFPFLFSLKRIIHSEYQSYSYRCVVDFNLISWMYLLKNFSMLIFFNCFQCSNA